MRSQKRFKLFLLPAIIASSYIYSCSLNKDKFKDDFEEIVKEIEDRLPSNKTEGTVLPITPIDEVVETGPGANQEPEVEPEPEPEPEVEPDPEIEPEPEPEVINKYLIRWFNHDGTLLEESEVNEGELPHYCGETPQQSNETELEDFNYFIGWDKEVVPATEDANYTAQFAIKEYTEDKFEYILSEDETYYEVTRASDDISGDLVLPSMHNGLPIKKVANNAFTLGGSLSDGLKIDSIYIPYGIEEIGEYAFKCINGLKEVYIPSTVKTINKEAFFGNNYITKITINDGVESIGSNAFYDIPKVKDFTFPKSLKNAGISAFHGFARETGFIVPGDCKLEEVGNKAFFYSGIVSGDFSNLKTLGRETFNSCYYLTDVKLSNKLEVIPYACFSDCRKLSSVQLPVSLHTLERDAFSNCPALEEVVLPPNITSIPYNLFYNDTNLKKVICLGEITSIDNFAFGKTALNSLIINDINKITSIGEGAFSNCNYFPGFPENIDTISNYLYSGNTSIENISFPDHIKTINDWAFKGCSNLKHVNLNKVEKINEMAFKESGLEEITLSSTITSFGNEVFADCVNLKTATLPENMETIPSGFFKGCKSLVNITLPESLTSIGANAFNGCEEMDNINLPSTLTSIGEAAFSSTSISEINIPLNVSEHTKAFKDNETLQTISFEEGITTLKGSVLLNCTNLETINLPSTITTIEVLAISGCINLKNINFNGTMEQWNAISKLTSTTGSGRSKKTHKWNGTNTDLVTGFTINCSDGEIAC